MPRPKAEIEARYQSSPDQGYRSLGTLSGCQKFLLAMRDEASGVIPADIIHSHEDLYYRKCRKNWWRGLITTLELMVRKNFLPDDIIGDVKSFTQKYNGHWFWVSEHRTEKLHIDEADLLITRIVVINNQIEE
jgi:hypothetical protein